MRAVKCAAITAYWPAKLAGLALLLFILWYAAAFPRGYVEAKIDVARGRYYVKTAGHIPGWWGLATQKLRDRYGIVMDPVAACEVWPWDDWYMHGYNRVSEPAIESRFGDAVNECFREASEEYHARPHP